MGEVELRHAAHTQEVKPDLRVDPKQSLQLGKRVVNFRANKVCAEAIIPYRGPSVWWKVWPLGSRIVHLGRFV